MFVNIVIPLSSSLVNLKVSYSFTLIHQTLGFLGHLNCFLELNVLYAHNSSADKSSVNQGQKETEETLILVSVTEKTFITATLEDHLYTSNFQILFSVQSELSVKILLLCVQTTKADQSFLTKIEE